MNKTDITKDTRMEAKERLISELGRESYGRPKLMRPIHKCVRKFGHNPVCHSVGDFAVSEHKVWFQTIPKPHETSL